MEKEDLLDTLENSSREREKLGQTIVRMAKAREDLVKEKHTLKVNLLSKNEINILIAHGGILFLGVI